MAAFGGRGRNYLKIKYFNPKCRFWHLGLFFYNSDNDIPITFSMSGKLQNFNFVETASLSSYKRALKIQKIIIFTYS